MKWATLAGLLLLTGCTSPSGLSATAADPTSSASTSSAASHSSAPAAASAAPAPTVARSSVAPGSCHARGLLPDPVCTPGATDPMVTQANLRSTICGGGWSTAHRPPWSWSGPVKRERMTAYGYGNEPAAGYELDHLIPIGLGGSGTSQANLWPERGASPNRKDDVELAAVHAVCGGRMPLAHAQQLMASDWTRLATELAVP